MRLEKGLEILRLAQEVKLLKNKDKGDSWKDDSFHDLLDYMMQEMAEVAHAIHCYLVTENGSEEEKEAKHDLILECADVANFAAIICEKVNHEVP